MRGRGATSLTCGGGGGGGESWGQVSPATPEDLKCSSGQDIASVFFFLLETCVFYLGEFESERGRVRRGGG